MDRICRALQASLYAIGQAGIGEDERVKGRVEGYTFALDLMREHSSTPPSKEDDGKV